MKAMIREYEERDASAVAELLARLQDHVAQLDQLKQFIVYDEFDKNKYLSRQLEIVSKKFGKIFVAEEDGKVVGAIVGWVNEESEDDQVELYHRRRAYVSDLSVDASQRRTGIGQALMTAMENYFSAVKCDYVALSCMALNAGARAFYQRLGYDDYYVRMVKSINKE